MLPTPSFDVAARQDPLRERYRHAPAEAAIVDQAATFGGLDADPFHGSVRVGPPGRQGDVAFGVHPAVGGFPDAPNPGDLLCGALAACLDSTIRIIANRLRIALTSLEVSVSGEVDVRGTLLVDRSVPVGFERLRCRVAVTTAPGTDPAHLDRLLNAAEQSCVNLQTLRGGVPVETELTAGGREHP